MILALRIALLEAVQVDAVVRFQRLPFAVRRQILDAAAHQLIRQGHLPPVDPGQPDVPLETHRREHPAQFLAWHAATLATEAWMVQHRHALAAAFFQALRETPP